MLRVTKLADYATVMMSTFALHQDKALSAVELEKMTHIALPTIRKVLKALVHAGLLDSTRGAAGGYMLVKTSECISVSEIVESVDGSLALTECCAPKSFCAQEVAGCMAKHGWQVINHTLSEMLSKLTLKDLVEGLTVDKVKEKLQDKVYV